ncbi:polyhydroxyalkanoate synthesis regulator DNA-binding domain-containing protein [Oscillochloris sp. ZM17-4]|uniref:polyhydroxyalkanoate synthesis regulator DNA-binding domain-containing protein n=1 Tax=Oscillochloris sp. ZM17-4 TaxID=2866714 RepID=UPI001C73078E|nr:polyhydroxyalkanoate synthesis regulator DNA-binding domain-containing protein [Oscillochloris sp. ZM17-4]MBX0329506.1 polyhydroxyalkanoate synthesis regulator DNA-binding domain-containing protein [Oscillochloris sp. ZM17-4]
MHTIKKYANRKLYHTNRKQYITLDGIAQLVQSGEAVQILDNETSADITSSILAQVVLQARGRSGPQLPTTLLTGMIQLGGDTIANLRRTLFGSLGGTDLIEAEIGRRIDALIERGEISPDEGVRWRLLLLRQEFADSAPSHITGQEIDMPSRNDVVRLHSQVDALASIVDQILKKQG